VAPPLSRANDEQCSAGGIARATAGCGRPDRSSRHAAGAPERAGAPDVAIATAIRADRSLDNPVTGHSSGRLTPSGAAFLRPAGG
jgi:hypothetical protein